jgi:hypothetical protein
MHGTLDQDEKAKERAASTERGLADAERGTLLAGLVIDAHGGEMVPSRMASSGATSARYYVGTRALPGSDLPEHIPAARLDASVVAMLSRIRLLGTTRRREEIAAIVRRVLVLDDAIILQLKKRLCLAAWRAQEPMLQRISTGDVVRLVATCLSGQEELSEAGTALCLKMPRHARARKPRSLRSPLLFQRKP